MLMKYMEGRMSAGFEEWYGCADCAMWGVHRCKDALCRMFPHHATQCDIFMAALEKAVADLNAAETAQ